MARIQVPSFIAPPPAAQTDEGRAITLWVQEALVAQGRALQEFETVKLTQANSPVHRPREGTIVYADGVNWNPGSGAGAYIYDNGVWKFLGGTGGGGGTFLTGGFTLNANSTTTTVSTTCTAASKIFWSALTLHAANQMATLFLSSIGTNTFTLTHGNNANVDQNFSYAVMG